MQLAGSEILAGKVFITCTLTKREITQLANLVTSSTRNGKVVSDLRLVTNDLTSLEIKTLAPQSTGEPKLKFFLTLQVETTETK